LSCAIFLAKGDAKILSFVLVVGCWVLGVGLVSCLTTSSFGVSAVPPTVKLAAIPVTSVPAGPKIAKIVSTGAVPPSSTPIYNKVPELKDSNYANEKVSEKVDD
jgi:hypothetical protein